MEAVCLNKAVRWRCAVRSAQAGRGRWKMREQPSPSRLPGSRAPTATTIERASWSVGRDTRRQTLALPVRSVYLVSSVRCQLPVVRVVPAGCKLPAWFPPGVYATEPRAVTARHRHHLLER